MTDTEIAAALNTIVTTKLAPSTIHGVGVFALRNLRKGEKLYAQIGPQVFGLPYNAFDKLIPPVRELLLERWPQVVNGSKFIYPDTQVQAFMNHQNKPNYDAVNDVMLEDIKEGDEITEDYRKIDGHKEVFPWL